MSTTAASAAANRERARLLIAEAVHQDMSAEAVKGSTIPHVSSRDRYEHGVVESIKATLDRVKREKPNAPLRSESTE